MGRIFVDPVLGLYARKSRERGICGGESGAFTVVQRTSSDLRLNPHYHSGFLDGVFAPDEEGKLVFRPLGSLSNSEFADLMQAVRIRVLGYLERRGVIESNTPSFVPSTTSSPSASRRWPLWRVRASAGSLPLDRSGMTGSPLPCAASRVPCSTPG